MPVVVLAALIGVLLAAYYAPGFIADYRQQLDDAGEGAYVMIGWAVLCVGWLVWQVAVPHLERWHYIRLGRRMARERDR